ncbi:unnamed protein product [Notodromas monacha]|uniref:TROVE domain-containing protein n=1 Tax=Notodromas monacha TaxID=399045 RepID=A0A7R9GBQ5_9CRUS|nr:unnamed protein product [Notodromas monacha]CAG0916772.1 unnamed protein product [Notodromas monacha]
MSLFLSGDLNPRMDAWCSNKLLSQANDTRCDVIPETKETPSSSFTPNLLDTTNWILGTGPSSSIQNQSLFSSSLLDNKLLRTSKLFSSVDAEVKPLTEGLFNENPDIFRSQPLTENTSSFFSGGGKLSNLKLHTETLYEERSKPTEVSLKRPLLPVRVERDTEGVKCPRYEINVNVPESPEDFPEDLFGETAQDVGEEKRHERLVKSQFLNAVTGSLIHSPDFKSKSDEFRSLLVSLAEKVAEIDPEFILKAALHARQDLYIRTTANFLLAYASYDSRCREFTKRYFKLCVVTPADWIDVAEMYQAFGDKSINFGSLPSTLRRALTVKFADFDVHQLSKYKSAGGKKRPKGKVVAQDLPNDGEKKSATALEDSMKKLEMNPTTMRQFGIKSKDVPEVVPEKDDDLDDLERRTFTIKQLIRFLHISVPAEIVMSLVGKKYPSNEVEFFKSKLPGSFDSSRAGKRMKLPTAETWETQIASKGNKAQTWQDLIDRKKLPFIATLRNIRNLILAGISKEHHAAVIRTLSSEIPVTRSKLPAFRFFTAFNILDELKKKLQEAEAKNREAENDAASGVNRKPCKRLSKSKQSVLRDEWWKKKQKRLATKARNMRYNLDLIEQYRKALNKAVVIATRNNIPPIAGKTWIFVDATKKMHVTPCQTARGLGKPRTLLEVGLLLGLMALSVGEDAKLFAGFGDQIEPKELKKAPGSVLDSLPLLLAECSTGRGIKSYSETFMDQATVRRVLASREKIDTFIVLTSNNGLSVNMEAFLDQYRAFVNPDFLYVSVNLAAEKTSLDAELSSSSACEKNVMISGFNEHLLRFAAERSGIKRIEHVDKIDRRFNLPARVNSRLMLTNFQSKAHLNDSSSLNRVWKTVQVFISSPFRDMHGERDLLGRYVFPILREKARQLRINLVEVDLRWGVPEDEENSIEKSLEMSLEAVAHSDIFIGILGERYGRVVENYEGISSREEFAWLERVPPGKSVTDLEMEFAVLADETRDKFKEKAFFFFRDPDSLSSVPENMKRDFLAESEESRLKLALLKSRIKASGAEVCDAYPAFFGGCVDGKPIMANLNEFAERVADQVWHSVTKMANSEEIEETKCSFSRFSLEKEFFGRQVALNEAKNAVTKISEKGGLYLITGKQGIGKTAFMRELRNQLKMQSTKTISISCFVDELNVTEQTVIDSSTIIKNLFDSITNDISLRESLVIEDGDEEVDPGTLLKTESREEYMKNFPVLLKSLVKDRDKSAVIFVDGFSDSQMADFWECVSFSGIPEGLALIVSQQEASSNGASDHSPKHRATDVIASKAKRVWTLGPLLVNERMDIVKNLLSRYGKALDDSSSAPKLRMLVSKRDAGNPLYLKLAVEEIRIFGLFEKLDEKIRKLGVSLELLFEEILRRLESEFGRDLVERIMQLILISRSGLQEQEIMDVFALSLTSDFDVRRSFVSGIPEIYAHAEGLLGLDGFGLVSRLLRSVKHWLVSPVGAGTVYLFPHRVLRDVASSRYLAVGSKGSTFVTNLHGILASYHSCKCWDEESDDISSKSTPRDLISLPYHFCHAGRFEVLGNKFLCNLRFIELKASLGLAETLLEDFKLVSKTVDVHLKCADKEAQKSHSILFESADFKEYHAFVRRHLHILASTPALVLQCALNERKESLVRKEAEERMAVEEGRIALVEWQNRPEFASDPCLAVVSGIVNKRLTVCCVSTDSNILAVAAEDAVIRLFCLETRREMKTFVGHSAAVHSLCFLGDEKLVSGSENGEICVWDVGRGLRLSSTKGHLTRVTGIAVNPDLFSYVSVGWDGKIKIWNTGDNRELSSVTQPKPVTCVSHHPTRNVIVTGGWDSLIRIWDTVKLHRIAILRGHTGSVRSIALSADGLTLASGSVDGTVRVWSSSLGMEVGVFPALGAGAVNSVAFTRDGMTVVSGGDDGRIFVWPTNSSSLKKCYSLPPSDEISCMHLQETTLNALAVGFRDGRLKMFNLSKPGRSYVTEAVVGQTRVIQVLCLFGGRLCAAFADGSNLLTFLRDDGKMFNKKIGSPNVNALSSHGSLVLAGYHDGTVWIFDAKSILDTGEIKAVSALSQVTGPVVSIAVNKLGTCLASASGVNSRVCVWKSAEILQPESDFGAPVEVGYWHSDSVTCVAWGCALGKDYLVTGSADATVAVYSSEKAKLLSHMRNGHENAVTSVQAEGIYVVSCSSDGVTILWAITGAKLATFTTTAYSIPAFRVNFAQKCEEDKTLSWADEVEAEEQEKQNSGRKDRKQILGDLEIEDALLVVADARNINVLQLFQGKEEATFVGHSGPLSSLSSFGSGGKFVTCGNDKTCRIWDTAAIRKSNDDVQNSETTDSAHVLRSPHKAAVSMIVILDSLRIAVTGDLNGVLVVWNMIKANGNWEPVQVDNSHNLAVSCACELRGVASKRLVTGSLGGDLFAWSAVMLRGQEKVLKKVAVPSWPKASAAVRGVVFESERKLLLVTTSNPPQVVLFTVENAITLRGRVSIECGLDINPLKLFVCGIQAVTQAGTTTEKALICDSACVRELEWKKGVIKKRDGKKDVVEAHYKMKFGATYGVKATNWLPCVFLAGLGDPNHALIACTDGCLRQAVLRDGAMHDLDGAETLWDVKKLHSSPINAMLPVKLSDPNDCFLITTANEQCIKIWKGWNVRDMQQVGKFECAFNLSSAKILRQNGRMANIIAGDTCGELHRFSVRFPRCVLGVAVSNVVTPFDRRGDDFEDAGGEEIEIEETLEIETSEQEESEEMEVCATVDEPEEVDICLASLLE